jgi:hypothetical protein
MFAWGHAVVRNNNLQKLSSNRLAVNSAWFISLFNLIYLSSSNNSMPLYSAQVIGICTENKMLAKIAKHCRAVAITCKSSTMATVEMI